MKYKALLLLICTSFFFAHCGIEKMSGEKEIRGDGQNQSEKVIFHEEFQPDGGTSVENASKDYIPTRLPKEITRLFERISSGNNLTKDTVFLIVQGGPMTELDKEGTKSFLGKILSEYPVYMVHQVQTYNPEVVKKMLTFEQVTREAKVSIEILQATIKYFKNKRKNVLLWGFSYGFFVIEELLATKPMLFKRAFLGGGRLDMTETVWKGFSQGIPYTFKEDGKTPVREPQSGDPKVLLQLAAALGQNRYTQLLKHKDLTKKILFYFGGKDQAVGGPTEDEIQFLKRKKALYLLNPNIGHDINSESEQKIMDFLLHNKKP